MQGLQYPVTHSGRGVRLVTGAEWLLGLQLSNKIGPE